MQRNNAKKLGDLLANYVKEDGLEDGLLRVRIFETWDLIVGPQAASLTGKKFYKDKNLYCKINSSVFRSQLYFQTDAIIKKMNSLLQGNYIDKIILS